MAEKGSQPEPKIRRFFPPASELDAPIRTNVPCSQPGCSRVFQQPSALRLHLEKSHKIPQPLPNSEYNKKPEDGVQVQFFCPVEHCQYHLNEKTMDKQQRQQHLSSIKALRMHYLKQHTEKTFKCTKCSKLFSYEKELNAHKRECGIQFQCIACNSTFSGAKSYFYHCSKYLHPIREELSVFRPGNTCKKPKVDKTNATEKTTTKPEPKYVLPNPNIVVMSLDVVLPPNILESNKSATDSTTKESSLSSSCKILPKQVLYIADARSNTQGDPHTEESVKQTLSDIGIITAKSYLDSTTTKKSSTVNNNQSGVEALKSCTCSKSSQDKRSMPKSRKQSSTPKFSAGTQTNVTRRKRTVAQTQTTGDFILRKAMQSADIPTRKESRGSQVSPRAKLKQSCGTASVQSSETQTTDNPRQPLRKRKRKRPVQVQDIATTTMTEIVTDQNSQSCDTNDLDAGFTLSIPENPWLSVADTETQTMALYNNYHASLGESHSTQTLQSFLLDTHSQDGSSQGTPSEITEDLDVVPSLESDKEPVERDVDMGFASNLGVSDLESNADTNTRSMACSPILNMSSNVTIDMGTDPLFDDQYSLLLPQENASFSTESQVNMDYDHRCDTNTGTQTTVDDNTDFPVLLTSGVQTSDFDRMYMNIQTQTMETDADMINQLLNNMQTQTTEEFLADFSFSDIETQTPMDMALGPDAAGSQMGLPGVLQQTIQTQTSLHTLSQPLVSAESTDMQTQTILNSMDVMNPDLADSYTQTAFTEIESIMEDLTK